MFDAQSYMFFPVGGSCMGNGVSAVNERRLWACVRAQENAMTASWFSSCSSHVNTYQYSSWVNIFGRIIETVAENNQSRSGNSEAGSGSQGIIDK